MTERASGWYDDPRDPTLLRYWDGVVWSDRTMPRVKPGLDQSRIGDSRRQYEDEQERIRQREQAQAGHRPYGSYPAQGPANQQQPGPPGQQQGPSGYQPRPMYPPQQVKTTPDGEPTASWWRRLFAYVIDSVLISLVALAATWTWLHPWLSKIANFYTDTLDAARDNKPSPPVPGSIYQVPWQVPVASLVVYLVYQVGMLMWRRQTVGHIICGIRVRAGTPDGPLSLKTATVRSLVKGVSYLVAMIPFLASLGSLFTIVDGLVPLGDSRAQSLHDKAAGTYVVRSNAPVQQAALPYQPQR